MARSADVLVLDSGAVSRRRLLSDLWRAREKLMQLARTDFRVRYKRAYFGLIWAVLLPLLQATVLAAVFSQFIRFQAGFRGSYAVFVLAGVLPWSYFTSTLTTGSSAIVDGAELTEKVWFPRAVLPMAPALANLVGLSVSMVALVIAAIVLHNPVGVELFLVVPAAALLVLFATSLSLVLSALHAYFRDVRYMVQAAMLVWFYASPVIYPAFVLKKYQDLLDLNPITGILDLFRLAVGQPDPHMGRALAVTITTTVVLLVIAVELYRRHDRLFVDTL